MFHLENGSCVKMAVLHQNISKRRLGWGALHKSCRFLEKALSNLVLIPMMVCIVSSFYLAEKLSELKGIPKIN